MLPRRAASTALPGPSRLAGPLLSQTLAWPWRLPSQATINSIRAFHSPRRRSGGVFCSSPLLRADQLRRIPSTSHLALRTYAFLSRPFPQGRSRTFRVFYRIFALSGFFVLSIGSFVVLFFLYDASTYGEEVTHSDVPVSERALNPRRGGPKNLPIVDCLLDDSDSPENERQKDKPRLVILGSGWGSVALLKTLNPDEYHVTVVSPTNYFLFSPMLPSATVGTLELRSLMEPIRRIVKRVNGHFLKANAEDVEFSEKLVEVSQVTREGEKRHFYLPYDKLVIGVGMDSQTLTNWLMVLTIALGSTTNTHGVSGLEHCHFLKSIDDARSIRSAVLQNLEHAVLPTTTDEERRRLLSFVVCGGGPTGVEFAAELFDMLNEDLCKYFPKVLRNEVSVHLIQSRGHILNTYDETLSRYAEERFAHDHVDVLTNARVKEVQHDKILFTQKGEHGETVTKELPMGFCLWSTGVCKFPLASMGSGTPVSNSLSAQTDFCKRLSAKVDAQKNKHALETDTHLRMVGAPLGDVYAVGDCSTVQNNVADNILTFLRTLAWEKGKNPEAVNLSFGDWCSVAQRVKARFPQAADHLRRLDKLFERYDKDKSGTLDFGELRELFRQVDSMLTSLPATAQRAHQQGQYLGRKFNKMAQVAVGLRRNEVDYGDLDETFYKAFKYRHMGSLAYVGNAAVFDVNGMSFSGGLLYVYLWRSVYFAQSVSIRTRILMAMDWAKRALFGRGGFSSPYV